VDDLKDAKVSIEKDKIIFSGKGGTDNLNHELTLELFGEVNEVDSKYYVRGRGVEILLVKPEGSQYWKRLLKDDKKHHWLRVDFDKWQDEDESEDEADMGGGMGGMGGGMGGMGGLGGGNFEDMMRQMGGLGGAGGFGGGGGADLDGFGEEADSDDEDLPELEETTSKDSSPKNGQQDSK